MWRRSSETEPRPPDDAPRRADLLLLALLAVAALAPALTPGLPWYLDNGAHLAEIRAQAEQAISLGQRLGWTDIANAGEVPGLLNAPLVWGPLAVFHALGLPDLPVYCAGLLLSNGALALGVYLFALRLWRRAGPAFVAAALACSAPFDLYGFAGAAAGMWPFRLAHGVALCGLSRWGSWGPGRWGLWLAVVLGLHSYTGAAAAAALLALGALSPEPGARKDAFAGLILGLLLSSWYWGPLLGPGMTQFDPFWTTSPIRSLVAATGAFDMGDFFFFGRLAPMGGGGGPIWALLTLGAAAVGARRVPKLRDATLYRLALAGLSLSLVAAFLPSLLDSAIAGPNPWRHLSWFRLGLSLFAGVALAPLAEKLAGRLAFAALLAALAIGAGRAEVLPSAPTSRDALSRTWMKAVAAAGKGRVYVEDTFFQVSAPPELRRSHPLGALQWAHGGRGLSAWYGVSTNPVVPWTLSEGGLLYGVERAEVLANPDVFYGRSRVYGVGAVLTTTPELAQVLGADPRYSVVYREGAFNAFRVVAPPQARLALPPDTGEVALVSRAPDTIIAEVTVAAPTPLRLRSAWHPWWRATLNGAPLRVAAEPDTGLTRVSVPSSGTVALRWRDRGLPWLAGLPLGLAFLLAYRRWGERLQLRPALWSSLALAHGLLWSLLLVPGHLLLDEGGYEMATRAIAQGPSLEIENGYREFASAELQLLGPDISTQVTAHGGRLVSQYPPGYAVMTAPLYALFGYTSLIAFNGLATLLVAALTVFLARRAQAPVGAALLLLFVGSFAWEYSLASMPHTPSMALALAALACAARSGDGGPRWALAAGICAGVGVSVRVDAVLLLPALAAALLVPPGARVGRAVAALSGFLPPMLALSWVNYLRFDDWSPLSYGVRVTDPAVHIARTSGLAYYRDVVLGALAMLGLWTLYVRTPRRGARVVLVVLALVLAIVAFRAQLRGLWCILGDMRALPMAQLEQAMSRGPTGAVVYLGQAKRGLLQSCPWLALLLVPLLRGVAGGPMALIRSPLTLMALGWIAIYGATSSHGGLCLNQRYLLPALPALAILAAGPLWALAPEALRDWRTPAARRPLGLGALALLTGALPAALAAASVDEAPLLSEHITMELPLVLALALALCELRFAAGDPRMRRWCWFLALACLGWGAGAAQADLSAHQRHRALLHEHGEEISALVEDNALVIGPTPDALFTLLERPSVRIASLLPDAGAGFWPLVAHHIKRGRPVVLVLPPAKIAELAKEGEALGLRIGTGVTLSRWSLARVEALRAPPPAAQPSPAR